MICLEINNVIRNNSHSNVTIVNDNHESGNFINTIEKVNNDLKRADYKGSFEADDEVGTIFKEIKIIISQLDQFKGEEQ